MIKILNLDVLDWARIAPTLVWPYDPLIGGPFDRIKALLELIDIGPPDFVRDLTVIWIALGRVVRRTISDMNAESEAMRQKYNPPPKISLRDKVVSFLSNPVGVFRKWLKKLVIREGAIATFFWPYRLYVDLRGEYTTDRIWDRDATEPREEKRWISYWGLSPKKVLIYLGVSVLILVLVVLADYVYQSGEGFLSAL